MNRMDMLKDVAAFIGINLFFGAFLALFAGLIYAFLSFQKWLTASAPIEIQIFTVPIFGLAAIGLTLWLMFSAMKWINRRRK